MLERTFTTLTKKISWHSNIIMALFFSLDGHGGHQRSKVGDGKKSVDTVSSTTKVLTQSSLFFIFFCSPSFFEEIYLIVQT
jgi:hypothetical protein